MGTYLKKKNNFNINYKLIVVESTKWMQLAFK